jgi:DNA-binding NarL/FixJ family response regulator
MAERMARARPPRTRVAIVDDHRLVLDGLLAHVSARRVDLDIVISATSWADLIGHPDFPVDVVVLDLTMNDGIPITTKIRALGSAGSRTVVMSRHADASSIHGAISAGAFGFVPKTESADELIVAIRTVADGLHYSSPSVAELLATLGRSDDPGLGRQEQRAMTLYAAGRSIKEVAEEMTTTDETVKSYIKRARRKYRMIGVDVGTKILLRRRGIREGWISPD